METKTRDINELIMNLDREIKEIKSNISDLSIRIYSVSIEELRQQLIEEREELYRKQDQKTLEYSKLQYDLDFHKRANLKYYEISTKFQNEKNIAALENNDEKTFSNELIKLLYVSGREVFRKMGYSNITDLYNYFVKNRLNLNIPIIQSSPITDASLAKQMLYWQHVRKDMVNLAKYLNLTINICTTTSAQIDAINPGRDNKIFLWYCEANDQWIY